MKILMVSQHYWPEQFINTDICETLVARGHEVTVLTALPNYPDGIIPEDYRLGRRRREQRHGVSIVRVPVVARGRSLDGLGKVRRAANYGSFWLLGSLRAIRLEPDFDVVFTCQTSPVTMSGPAVAYARRNGAKVLLWCCDLSPADLLVSGVSRTSAVYRYYRSVSRAVYGSADLVAVTSPMFMGYLSEEDKVERDRLVYLPQYAEDVFASSDGLPDLDQVSQDLFDPRRVNLVFAGNVGNYQAAETIVRAAVLLAKDDRIAFHIIGSGSRLEACREIAAANRLENVVFHGRQPFELMPAYYRRSDAMFITQYDNEHDPVVSFTLPRRTQTILASGKPIIAAASGEVARVIEDARCGYWCHPEDSVALAQLCTTFASISASERASLSANARAYFENHFSKLRFFEDLEAYLQALHVNSGKRRR